MLNKIQTINSAPAFTSRVVMSRADAEELNCIKGGKKAIDAFRKKLAKDGKSDVVEINVDGDYNEWSRIGLSVYPENSNLYMEADISGMWHEPPLDFDKLYKAALTQDRTTKIGIEHPLCYTGKIDLDVKQIWLG